MVGRRDAEVISSGRIVRDLQRDPPVAERIERRIGIRLRLAGRSASNASSAAEATRRALNFLIFLPFETGNRIFRSIPTRTAARLFLHFGPSSVPLCFSPK